MGLRLFFLPNFPGAMFIQGGMFIPDSRVVRLLKSFEFDACNLSPPFQYNVLQQSSNVLTVENVSHPLTYAMMIMTVGIILMKETVQVKFQYWPGSQNPKTEILYHQKPLYAGLGI